MVSVARCLPRVWRDKKSPLRGIDPEREVKRKGESSQKKKKKKKTV